MGAQQSTSRTSKGNLTSKSSKGSLVDVAAFDFRREEMIAAAEFRRDYFQSRFSTELKNVTHLSSLCKVTVKSGILTQDTFTEKRTGGAGNTVQRGWSTPGWREEVTLSIFDMHSTKGRWRGRRESKRGPLTATP